MAHVASAAFLNGCVIADAMPAALSELAAMAGGDGAVLIRTRRGVSISAVASQEIVKPVEAYVRGDRPADARMARVNPGLDEGFRLDQDDFTPREIAADPYYQEFLRPLGLGWHACAKLGSLPGGDEIHFGIKRQLARGPFSQNVVAPLAVQLPLLRSAVSFTQMLLRDTMPGFDSSLGSPGRSILGFNSLGEAFSISAAAGEDALFTLRGGALALANASEQSALNRLLEEAIRLARPMALMLRGPDAKRYALRIKPWPVLSQGPAAFIGVLSALDRVEEPTAEWIDITRALFNLSAAEARVAALVGQGQSAAAVARRLALRTGTVRNHLKAVFEKTGVTRQAELSALLSRL